MTEKMPQDSKSQEPISALLEEIKTLPLENVDEGARILKTGGYTLEGPDGGRPGPKIFIDADGKLKKRNPDWYRAYKEEHDVSDEIKNIEEGKAIVPPARMALLKEIQSSRDEEKRNTESKQPGFVKEIEKEEFQNVLVGDIEAVMRRMEKLRIELERINAEIASLGEHKKIDMGLLAALEREIKE